MASEYADGTSDETRMNEAEAEATQRIETAWRIAEEADAATDAALTSLSTFMEQVQEAKRVLRARPNLVGALASARDQIGRPPSEGERR